MKRDVRMTSCCSCLYKTELSSLLLYNRTELRKHSLLNSNVVVKKLYTWKNQHQQQLRFPFKDEFKQSMHAVWHSGVVQGEFSPLYPLSL